MNQLADASGKICLVSVIIPVYNVESYLRECLESVVNQTFQNTEIICVNDGSTDSSRSILQGFREKDPRIRIIDQEKQGLGAARNVGAKAATGKYLYFMDGDDVLEENALEILTGKMEHDFLDVVQFNAEAFGVDPESVQAAMNKNRTYFHRYLNEEKIFSGQELFTELKRNSKFVTPVWISMIKRSFFFENGLWFNPIVWHQDEPWSFSLLMKAKRVKCVNRILYKYRLHSGSITMSKPSFKHSYGCFISSQMIQQTICELADEMDPDFFELCVSHAVNLQNHAINKYRNCNEDEKLNRKELPSDERISFEKIVVLPASLRDQAEQQKSKNESEKKKLTEEKIILTNEKKKLTIEIKSLNDEKNELENDNIKLKEENRKVLQDLANFKKENDRLHKEIVSVYQSETFCVGDRVTRIPRMIKDRFRRKDKKN